MLRLSGLAVAWIAGAVSVSPWVHSSWASVALAALAIALGILFFPQSSARGLDRRWELWAGVGSAMAVAAWFRFQHWQTVPAGYLGEVLNFVNFAQYLRDNGFPYQPYAWYAHTLFSYIIALVNVVVPHNLLVLRLAQILVSMATVAAVSWCSYVLFGGTAAWTTTALVATSWWHLWATRNGYHQFLTPLFQAIVLGGLVRGLRDKRRSAFVVAALGIAGGLHAYWALYLMVPVAIAIVALFFLRWPAEWKQVRSGIAITALLALAFGVPAVIVTARAPEGFSYVLGGLQPVRVGAQSLRDKLEKNADFLRRALFPHPGQKDRPPVVTDSLIRGGFLVGVATALRQAPGNLAAAAVLLLLVTNLVGLIVAITNEFYLIALFLPLFLLAGQGYAILLRGARQSSRVAHWVLVAGFIAAWAHYGQASAQRFFTVWAASMFRSPEHPQGRAFLLLPHWQRCTREASCMVPSDEPGRDFEGEALELGATFPEYRWQHALRRLRSDNVLFTPAQLTAGKALRLFVPESLHVTKRLLPAWQHFYPGLRVHKVTAPPPWDRGDRPALALEIEIPWGELQQRFASGVATPGRTALFWAPEPGPYQFRRFVPGSLGGVGNEPAAVADSVMLERGYHVLVFEENGWAWTGWQVRRFGMGWEALDHYVAMADDAELHQLLLPYLGKVMRPAASEWKLSRKITAPGLVWDMAFCPDQSLVAISEQRLYRIEPNTGATRELAAITLPDPAVRCTDSGPEIVGRDGRWLRWSAEGFVPMAQIPCMVRAVAKAKGPLTALCTDSRLWLETGQALELRDRFGEPLPQPVAVERCGNQLYVLDAALAELLAYSNWGQLVTTKVVPNVWWETELTCAEGQALFVLQWHKERAAYNTTTGEPLFHPKFERPWVFTRGKEGFSGFGFRRFVTHGHLGAWTRDAEIELLEHRPIEGASPREP